MKTRLYMISFLCLFVITMCQYGRAQQTAYQDDELTSEAFTLILKEQWEYLRNATEQLDKETGIRGEFETTPEFQARAVRARQSAIEKLRSYIKENKFDKRIFSVWLKLTLITYNADAGIYSVACPPAIEAPYDIPTVVCSVPSNQYLEIADSIRGGYRKAAVKFLFDPDFKWRVARSDAMAAKADEANLYFKVQFSIDMTLENLPTKATLKIIPKTIAIVNKAKKQVFWSENIKSSGYAKEQVRTPGIKQTEPEFEEEGEIE